MTRNFLIALVLAFCSTVAAAQSDRSQGGRDSPPDSTPSGTEPATPATPADPGTSPATPATPASPGKGAAKGHGKKDFSALDANGDGSLSKDELKAEASISAKFRELDKDKDGKLSSAEFSAFESK
jgi:hypothetical protein